MTDFFEKKLYPRTIIDSLHKSKSRKMIAATLLVLGAAIGAMSAGMSPFLTWSALHVASVTFVMYFLGFFLGTWGVYHLFSLKKGLKGSLSEMRYAILLTIIPMSFSSIIYGIFYLTKRDQILSDGIALFMQNHASFYGVIGFINLLIGFWIWYMASIYISETQKISKSKSFLLYVICSVFISLPGTILLMILTDHSLLVQ